MSALAARQIAPYLDAINIDLKAFEVAALDEHSRLLTHKQMTVFVDDSEIISHLFREIGRLREITFREMGEGIGGPWIPIFSKAITAIWSCGTAKWPKWWGYIAWGTRMPFWSASAAKDCTRIRQYG